MENTAQEKQPLEWRRELAALCLLLLAVAAIWIAITGRTRAQAWQEPLSYRGDALYYLAMAKASAENHAWPFLWKEVPRLNAPSGASWNDFPIVNEPLWSLLGISCKVFGLAGTTLFPVLLAHLLAAIGFYGAARCWGGRRSVAAVLSLLFALSPYLMRRSFVHLNLTFAWHLPLAAVIALWAAQPQGLSTRPRFRLGLLAAVLCGLQATYYAFFFLLLLAGAMAFQVRAARFRQLLRPALLALLTVLFAAAGNLDTLTFAAQHGKNTLAVDRSLSDVELYALKPVELFLPREISNGELTGKLYYALVTRHAELGAAYLGVVGGVGLLWLLGATFLRLASDREKVAPEAWPAILGLAFGIAGGANTAMAIAGVQLFRAGNRVSVLLLVLALLFLARRLSEWRPSRRFLALSLMLVVFLCDRVPQRNPALDASAAQRFAADRALAQELEAAIPGGRIFQLPVALYPEAPPIRALEPYELLGLYTHSWSLQFTYGAHRGRGFERWQEELLTHPWKQRMILLRERGFVAVAVYGQAYLENGAKVVAAIEAAGGGPIFRHAARPISVILLPPNPTISE